MMIAAMDRTSTTAPDFEYIVVGSGAGGGTVAARLAEAGHTVLVLEAGGDPRSLSGGDTLQPDVNRLPHDYDVPAFHAFASENEAMRWDFFVRHYADDAAQRQDWKYVEQWEGRKVDGVLYPRAGTLGGCTAHNAQILIYPFDSDWQGIADLTGDASWRPAAMRKWFEKLENCHHRPPYRWLAKLGLNPTRHGWHGWLHTEKAIPMAALLEGDLFRTIADCAEEDLSLSGNPVRRVRAFFESWADPNDRRTVRGNPDGPCYMPLTTKNHARMGTRERLLETARAHPNLRIQLNALATRVVLDERNHAVGVEYLEGERLYRASAAPHAESGEMRRVYASREVILAGGAFNTPQLLMLSGIGPAAELKRWGIPVRVDLPGVGRNLQDRYEISVANRMDFSEWELYKGVRFAPGDPQFREWQECRSGIYATNGSVLSIFKRSPKAEGAPDLFCMALLTNFQGYYPTYSRKLGKELNYLTWTVLKARTRNRAGEIMLRSADPRDTPAIDFRYFDEGGDEDLEAVVDGIRFVRRLTDTLRRRNGMKEEVPGDDVQSDEALKSYVRNNAWGHHASCSCAIGAVLSSDFRVHGTEGLRVVDASVFPRIPGTFIASAVYMIAEKAAAAILAGQ